MHYRIYNDIIPQYMVEHLDRTKASRGMRKHINRCLAAARRIEPDVTRDQLLRNLNIKELNNQVKKSPVSKEFNLSNPGPSEQ